MTHAEKIRQQIRNIELLGDSAFRSFEWEIVTHYRRHEEDQEWIAIALSDKCACSADVVVRDRVSEILAMLDHVHDPLITAL